MDVSPIPLPYGKSYHLFLSFCQEDEERAYSETGRQIPAQVFISYTRLQTWSSCNGKHFGWHRKKHENSLSRVSEIQRKSTLQNGNFIRNHGGT